MPNEPIQVQLAVLLTNNKYIKEELDEAKLARKEQYKVMEELGRTMMTMNTRLESVESALKQQAPTIEEFITIKHKVVGAGMFGKWVWGAAGALLTMIGLVISARSGILQWLMGK